MKQEKYFYLLLSDMGHRKEDILLMIGGTKAEIVSDPNSLWRRLLRFLRINKSTAYKLKNL